MTLYLSDDYGNFSDDWLFRKYVFCLTAPGYSGCLMFYAYVCKGLLNNVSDGCRNCYLFLHTPRVWTGNRIPYVNGLEGNSPDIGICMYEYQEKMCFFSFLFHIKTMSLEFYEERRSKFFWDVPWQWNFTLKSKSCIQKIHLIETIHWLNKCLIY